MANETHNEDGVWRTIRGTRIFIKDGQSVNDAIAEHLHQYREKSEAERLNGNEKYLDTVKNNGKVVIDHGKLMFNGKEVDKLDTSEANGSLAQHLDKNGNLTDERLALHQKVIEDYFKGAKPYAEGDEKVAQFTGGGSASGKGYLTTHLDECYGVNHSPIKIDPDDIKKTLCSADGRQLNDKLTPFYHEESSALAKQIYSTAIKNNYPVLYDGTATSTRSTMGRVNLATEHGYKTQMSFMTSDMKTVRANSLARYEETDRLVPWKNVCGIHQKAVGAVGELNNKFDQFRLYDNSNRNLKLVATNTKGGTLKILDDKGYTRFQNSWDEFEMTTAQLRAYDRDVQAINSRKGK